MKKIRKLRYFKKIREDVLKKTRRYLQCQSRLYNISIIHRCQRLYNIHLILKIINI